MTALTGGQLLNNDNQSKEEEDSEPSGPEADSFIRESRNSGSGPICTLLPGPCSGEDPSVGRHCPRAVDLELGQAQVDVGPKWRPGAGAQLVEGVSDVSDDETHADALLGEDTAGAAAAQVAEVAGSSVEGVCKGGGRRVRIRGRWMERRQGVGKKKWVWRGSAVGIIRRETGEERGDRRHGRIELWGGRLPQHKWRGSVSQRKGG
jgi:hypothetical protein